MIQLTLYSQVTYIQRESSKIYVLSRPRQIQNIVTIAYYKYPIRKNYCLL